MFSLHESPSATLDLNQVSLCLHIVNKWAESAKAQRELAPTPPDLLAFEYRIKEATQRLQQDIAAIPIMDALQIVGQSHAQFGTILKDRKSMGYDPRVFDGTGVEIVPDDLQDLPRLVETAKADLMRLKATVADAQKHAKSRWRCRRRQFFGILAKVFNYSACVLGVGAFVSLFTGPGAIAAPALGTAAALASAAAAACTALQGRSTEVDFIDVLENFHETIDIQSKVVENTLNIFLGKTSRSSASSSTEPKNTHINGVMSVPPEMHDRRGRDPPRGRGMAVPQVDSSFRGNRVGILPDSTIREEKRAIRANEYVPPGGSRATNIMQAAPFNPATLQPRRDAQSEKPLAGRELFRAPRRQGMQQSTDIVNTAAPIRDTQSKVDPERPSRRDSTRPLRKDSETWAGWFHASAEWVYQTAKTGIVTQYD